MLFYSSSPARGSLDSCVIGSASDCSGTEEVGAGGAASCPGMEAGRSIGLCCGAAPIDSLIVSYYAASLDTKFYCLHHRHSRMSYTFQIGHRF